MTRAWIAALLLPLAACGGSDRAEDVDAVEAAAQEQADRFSSGDFSGAWDMWAADAQEAVPVDAYVAFAEACAGTGMPLEVDGARIEEPGDATVRLGLGGVTQSYAMTYEGDEWRWVPTDATLERFTDGADAAIEQARQEGSCVEG